jgi:hypothetical protein
LGKNVGDDSNLEEIVPLIQEDNLLMAEIRRLSIFDVPNLWPRPEVGTEISAMHARGH